MQNPLLNPFNTPFETVPFDQIKSEHFIPALKEAVARGRKEIETIKVDEESGSFERVIEPLERSGYYIDVVSTIFFNLLSAESNDQLQAIAKELSPLLTEYANDILLDEQLFAKVKTVYDRRTDLSLTEEQRTLLTQKYRDFVRNGAMLSAQEKLELRQIDKELAQLAIDFAQNVLQESNAYSLEINDSKDLAGLPHSVIEAARAKAQELGKENCWIFTLDYPSYIPFISYADNRQLRQTIYMAMANRCCLGSQFDNSSVIKKIVKLRHQRAQLLGYKTHADFVLEERMAMTVENVTNFLNELLKRAKEKGQAELAELKSCAEFNDLMPWDTTYYFEKLKKGRFNIDDEILRPYFKLEDVLQGVFQVANKLYGLKFKETKDVAVYHPDVVVYEVFNSKNEHQGILYGDFFPRPGKRNGAWMTAYRGQKKINGCDLRPHISIVCNFTKPSVSEPSLLRFMEVRTLFHEFGHALHGLLSDCTYASLAGPQVYWDFVELPSQIMENWSFEKECLELFAKHFQTGEMIPLEFVQKIRESANFHEASRTLRQLSFGLLDMAWHTTGHTTDNVEQFEKDVTKDARLLEHIDGTSMSCSFNHIFSGAYSAGYYSYKWAEVLDADAFELFQKQGIFDRTTATSFCQNVLARGGSEHPMKLYQRFRGKGPSIDALLRRSGLL